MNTICRLCKKSDQLCRSHIVPEFLYRPLYDDKHRYSILTKGTASRRYGQSGLSEKLLCFGCEQYLCKYESYAAKVLSGREGHHAQQQGGYITVRDIDYTQFKVFLMSILWRASVSSMEFFKLVSLGPREERLKKLIAEGEPGSPEEFGCIVTFAHDKGSDMSDTFFNPEPMRWAGRRMYKFFFAGAVWLYHCDSRPPAPHLQRLLVRPGEPLTGLIGDFADAQYYEPAAKIVAKRWGYV